MGKAKAKGAKGAKGSGKQDKKRTDKVVEDKTFGLKNKNRSKKVQQFIQQVNKQAGAGGKSKEFYEQQAARKKAEKEAKAKAEREMLAMLGEGYALSGKTKKVKSKQAKKSLEEIKKKEQDEKEQQRKADAKDFGTPICSLRECFGRGSRATVERLCVELIHKDNLAGKAHDGSPCLFLKVSDGTTLNPMTMALMGETPQTFSFKVGNILDVRNCVAMVRGERVTLELPKGAQGLSQPSNGVNASMERASDRLSEYVKDKIQEEEEIRERGGIPIEERIEEARANLPADVTPITKERFLEWKAKKIEQKLAAAEKAKKEATKKTTGKGQVLSGKALFAVNEQLFKDDDDENVAAMPIPKDDGDDTDDDDETEGANGNDGGANPPKPPAMQGSEGATAASAIQETLYLDGDDDLDDLDDLDDDDDEEEEEE